MTTTADAGGLTHGTLTARRMWQLFEPVHAISYFAPQALRQFEEAGLRGFWRGYFAGRAAPLGAVGPAPVTAAFFSFAPRMTTRALPDVWDLISPDAALGARAAGAAAALRAALDLAPAAPLPGWVTDAADALAGVIAGLDGAGRPLGGPNAALPLPGDPLARLWHAATVLREHRGDGHVAALVAAGLDGCESLVLRTAADRAAAAAGTARGGRAQPAAAPAGSLLTSPSAPREVIQKVRGWTDEEWAAAADRLAGRGLADGQGVATPAGLALHQDLEQATDLAAARPWLPVPAAAVSQLAQLLRPATAAAATVLPFPNPVGVPALEPEDGPGS